VLNGNERTTRRPDRSIKEQVPGRRRRAGMTGGCQCCHAGMPVRATNAANRRRAFGGRTRASSRMRLSSGPTAGRAQSAVDRGRAGPVVDEEDASPALCVGRCPEYRRACDFGRFAMSMWVQDWHWCCWPRRPGTLTNCRWCARGQARAAVEGASWPWYSGLAGRTVWRGRELTPMHWSGRPEPQSRASSGPDSRWAGPEAVGGRELAPARSSCSHEQPSRA